MLSHSLLCILVKNLLDLNKVEISQYKTSFDRNIYNTDIIKPFIVTSCPVHVGMDILAEKTPI